MLSRHCSNPAIPSSRSSQKSFSANIPIPSFRYSFVQSNKRKPCSSTSLRISPRKRIECRKSDLEEVGFAPEEDLTTGIRRKKLAVFVSGGGSNFRSIHETCLRGSVHGDVVVLVTNKQGCGGAEFARDKRYPCYFVPKIKR